MSNNAPWWFDFLQASSDWGIPPWEVENAPYHWFEKWQAWTLARSNREKIELEKERAKWQKPSR